VEGMQKVETVMTDESLKQETSAWAEYSEAMENEYERSNSLRKKSTKSAYGNFVGVIKQKFWSIPPYTTGCGEYDELWVFMDCEDSNNNNNKGGWTGATVVDRNITLKFCLVPQSLFSRSKYHTYAVLDLNWEPYANIERYFDNEDDGNTNYVKLNGTEINPNYYFPDALEQSNNTLLSFYVFWQDANNGSTTFPNLGIQYGVFGTLSGKSQGYVYSDDEDNSNVNYCAYGQYLVMSGSTLYPMYWEIIDMIEPNLPYGENTTFYMSRVQ